MRTKHFKAAVAVFLALAASNGSRAEDLVGYRVSADCTEDWNVLVNGTLVVRHRPTGFGRCLYSGNLNRVAVGGTNTAELVRAPGQDPGHAPEPGGCLKLEIRFVGDYRGASEFEAMDTLLKFSGSASTNLLFVVGRPVPPLVGGSVAPPDARLFSRTRLVQLGIVLYALFVNLYGFFMVVNDRSATKRLRRRISPAAFVWNAILGGGIGQLTAMVAKRHNTDKPVFTVGIPAVVLLQIAIAYFGIVTRGLDLGLGIAEPVRRFMTSIKGVGAGWAKFGRSLDRSDQGVIQ